MNSTVPAAHTHTPALPQSSAAPSSATISELAQLFKILSDETRLRIVVLLYKERELNVRSLCARLGYSQPAVSHHLALMKLAGLIACRRDGKHNFYHLLPTQLGDLAELIPDISNL